MSVLDREKQLTGRSLSAQHVDRPPTSGFHRQASLQKEVSFDARSTQLKQSSCPEVAVSDSHLHPTLSLIPTPTFTPTLTPGILEQYAFIICKHIRLLCL